MTGLSNAWGETERERERERVSEMVSLWLIPDPDKRSPLVCFTFPVLGRNGPSIIFYGGVVVRGPSIEA